MRYDNNLRYAVKLIGQYKGTIPLSTWLKEVFRMNKQMGSSDRRVLSELMYCYYRLGHSLKHIPVDKKILIAFFLCNNSPHPLLQHFKPGWSPVIDEPIQAKLEWLQQHEGIKTEGIFPFEDRLSEGVDQDAFEQAFLIKPTLFIRIRPRKKNEVIGKLKEAGIGFNELADDCISLPNGTKVDIILKLDEEAVIQDYNSQQTAAELKAPSFGGAQMLTMWDCCAASGGKSIMIKDRFPAIDITVSDKRKIILENLEQRFARAGISNYRSFVADLSNHLFTLPTDGPKQFDLIVCDAPCTGSGTWSRTPEQLYFFNHSSIEKYSLLQKQIVENIVSYLAPGGSLLYITCSVFKRENEEIVAFMKDHLQLKVVKTSLLKGYTMQADSMYAALLTAPSV